MVLMWPPGNWPCDAVPGERRDGCDPWTEPARVRRGLYLPAKAKVGKAAKEQALDAVALPQIVLEQEEIRERCRKVIDLDLGIHLRLRKFMQVPQQRYGTGIVAEAAQCEGAVVREHVGIAPRVCGFA